MPSQLLDACLEVLLHEVRTLILIVLQHHALQDSLWELQFAHLLLHVLTNVEQELIVAVGLELLADLVGNLLAELLLVLHSAFAKHAVEQLLVDGGRLEVADFGHLEAEVALQILHLLLLHLQQCSNLSIVVGISLLQVEGDDVAGLGTLELLLLLFTFYI